MKIRIVMVLLLVGAIGWFGLLLMQRQLGVGSFAESPQQVRLAPGRRAVVGGGRAVLGFVNGNLQTVAIEVRCAAETTRVRLQRSTGAVGDKGNISQPICGVEIRWVHDAPAGRTNPAARTFEISWSE